jgi:hypothetical protein
MTRLLCLLALCAGCGSVQPLPDAGIDLMRGCVLKAQMEEASWANASSVTNSCGGAGGTISVTPSSASIGAAPAMDASRNRVGSFSGDATCIDFANTPALHGTTGLTMSAWIRPTALDNVDSFGIITKRSDRSVKSEYSLFVWTGNHVWVDLGDSDRFSGTAILTNNVWVQVTAVFDGTRLASDRVRLFVNGVLDPLQHTTIGNLGTTLPSYDAPVHVGCTPAPAAMTQQTFNGNLDDVTIWDRALSDDEIAKLYANG